MKTEEIIENNKLIAEFMGWDKYNNGVYYTPFDDASYCGGEPTHIVNYPQHLKFHFSWDWLMPVVKKIENLGYTVTIAGILCKITKVLDIENPVASLVCGDRSKKLEIVYETIIQFIKWYNENK